MYKTYAIFSRKTRLFTDQLFVVMWTFSATLVTVHVYDQAAKLIGLVFERGGLCNEVVLN